MNLWAFKRMAIAYSIVFLIIGLITFAFIYIYFIDVDSTCFDGKKNQNEVSIDCGGVCGGACPIYDKEGLILWSRAFEIGEGVYSLGAYTESNIVGFKAYDVPFEIEYYDEVGGYINKHQGKVDLYPGIVNPIFVPRITTGSRIISTTQLRFTETPLWQKHNPAEVVELKISEERLDVTGDTPKVIAKIENVDVRPANRVIAYATVFDERGNSVAMTQTFVSLIKPAEKKDITFNWGSDFVLVTQSCEKPVDFYIYNFSENEIVENYVDILRPLIGKDIKLSYEDMSIDEEIPDEDKESLHEDKAEDEDEETPHEDETKDEDEEILEEDTIENEETPNEEKTSKEDTTIDKGRPSQIIVILDEFVDEVAFKTFNDEYKKEGYITLLLPVKDEIKQEYIRSLLPPQNIYKEFNSNIARKLILESGAGKCDVDISRVEIITKFER